MDSIDRQIVNRFQGGFPIAERPYADAAAQLGIDEAQLIERLQVLLDEGYLSRFGPLYQAERLGGALSLAAMRVPESRFEIVAAAVNRHPQVAHNYRRAHEFNMWFVLATESPEEMQETLAAIEEETGLCVYNFPKQREFYVGLQLEV